MHNRTPKNLAFWFPLLRTGAGYVKRLGVMKVLLAPLLAFVVGCTGAISSAEAKRIAASRLSELVVPSQSATQIEVSLSVTQQEGKHIVEFRENTKNLMWAVIVMSDGSSEVSRTKIHD